MKKNLVLQYLSTASDTFLIVGFAVLVALPFAVSLGVQPIKKEETISEQKVAYAKSDLSNILSKQVPSTEKKVLGVETQMPIQNPLEDVNVKFLQSSDLKKYVNTSSYASLTSYSTDFTVMSGGQYGILKITNNSNKQITVNSQIEFLDNKSSTIGIVQGENKYSITKGGTTNIIKDIKIDPSKDITYSIITTTKNLGSFRLTLKLS